MASQPGGLVDILVRSQDEILAEWMKMQMASVARRSDLIREDELKNQSRQVLEAIVNAARKSGVESFDGADWADVRALLSELSATRARQGFSPSETASFVLSLKEPVFARLRKSQPDAEKLGAEVWAATAMLDKLALVTTESYSRAREEVIKRQQEELIELSTPVVKLWDGILAVPLIGTLDSARTQVVMESLLQQIVDTGSSIAIIDITGVPTVDTLVAQHLLKTVAAARLMGADCIISGVRPQIAQTIVHLGVNLGDVITKPSLAHALALAFRRAGLNVVAPKADHAQPAV